MIVELIITLPPEDDVDLEALQMLLETVGSAAATDGHKHADI